MVSPVCTGGGGNLHDLFHVNVNGDQPLYDAASALRQIQSEHYDAQNALSGALQGIKFTYTGAAADQMQSAFQPLIDSLGQGAQIAENAAKPLVGQANAYYDTASKMQPYQAVPPEPWYEGVDPFNTSYDNAKAANSNADTVNQAAYRQYGGYTMPNTVAAFDGTNVPMTLPSAPPPPASGQQLNVNTGGRPAGIQRHAVSGGPAYRGGAGVPGTTGPGGGWLSQPMGGGPTNSQSYTPAPMQANPIAPPASVGPIGPSGGNAGFAGGMMPVGGGFGGGGGYGPRGFAGGSAGRGGPGAGSGGRSGVGGAQEESIAAAESAAQANRSTGGMGGGPMGGRGRKKEDAEHKTAGYLVNQGNGNEIVGDLPPTAPPTIGM